MTCPAASHTALPFLCQETDMDKKELLFYDAYEAFYAMAKTSRAFRAFCRDAFGADFSQDGFSNIEQINMILPYIPRRADVHVLDIGCGNGKMLGYLQERTACYIHGFDYSEEAIRTAQMLYPEHADFREGIIGEIAYPEESFDVITSMDTMYFAKDMTSFVGQIRQWLKEDGVFFVGYQEGDVIAKTEHMHATQLAQALTANGMRYDVTDITAQTYALLQNKRRAALAHRQTFEAEGNRAWFDLLMGQTEYAAGTFEQFRNNMARYIYVARK